MENAEASPLAIESAALEFQGVSGFFYYKSHLFIFSFLRSGRRYGARNSYNT